MNHETQSVNSAPNDRRGHRVADYTLIATMIVFVVVALGVSTSFELAAVFSTCLGALVTLAAAGARLLGKPSRPSDAPVQARLLRPSDETAAVVKP